MMNESKVVGPLLGVAALGLLSAVLFYGFSHFEERERQHKLAVQQAKTDMKDILSARNQTGFAGKCTKVDPWGTCYEVQVVEGDEKVVKSYHVRSAGPDQLFSTDDDLADSNSDLNWTNAGQAAGSRAGRATRGFFKGLWNSDDGK